MLTLTIDAVRDMIEEVLNDTELQLFYSIKMNNTSRADLLAQLDVLQVVGDNIRGRIDRITAGE